MPRSPLSFFVFALLISLLTPSLTLSQSSPVVIGANVNMVSGADFPGGDPFQRQQNEPSVAFSSRNSLHLLSGANDYRAVDVPGLPGGRETGDSWLSYFWSTNGGATWKSTLIPGYPQDPACQSANPPTLCGYAAGADPVVRAGVNGMFYYSGIVFERGDPSRSAIFVSRFIDLNNDEGGDPIRFIDTTLIDTNDDGAVFLDKSWIGVDIPRGMTPATKSFSDIEQRGGFLVDQTVQCGNIYVGYAAIGGEGADLSSEIRLATSTDCGDTWAPYVVVSEPDSLNQGANIGIAPMTGELHVVWRRFDTVETFLGIPASGCPSDPASWEVAETWPTASITLGGVNYTRDEALEILRTKHRGDETYKVAYEVIAAKLNLLTGGGDPAPGFDPTQWAQELTAYVAQADAWLVDNPLGSDPKQGIKQTGLLIKESIQEIQLGSGTCSGGSAGTPDSTTGETNAIMASSSFNGGQTFTTPVAIDESSTFDQGSTTFSFRTTAYPSITVDADGRAYVAWAARGFATVRADSTEGDARIVVSTSDDGEFWSTPYAVDDDPSRPGHQIKPSLLFAGGQLTLVYYDFRKDISNIFDRFVIDLPDPSRLRHTVDVRIATATPALNPIFSDYSLISGTDDPVKSSTQASRYTFLASNDPLNPETVQAEYMPPNFPMFADGTTPFIGDYVDVAAPNLLVDGNGTWRFATQPGEVQVWQAVWSDNRDVRPPPDGDWGKYVAPVAQAQASFFDPTVVIPRCEDVTFPDAPSGQQAGSLYTGTRNQNVYSASISNGLIVAAPGNNRPLILDDSGQPLLRGFVVYVLNSTGQERTYQLTVQPPAGIDASFAADTQILTKQIVVPPFSSGAETVYAALSGNGAPASEAVPVQILDLTAGSTLAGTVVLNNDSEAPAPLTLAQQLSLLEAEVHNPAILNPAILNPAILNASVEDPSLCLNNPDICVLNPAILNPAILNPAILNPAIFNPAILNPAILNPAILNPAIFNPAILNPAIFNPAILNPAILNPAIFNPAIFNPAIFNPAILNPAILNPAILNPAILNPAILNPAILNPAILNPAILNPAILNPAILNTTVDGDTRQVDVTFAVVNEGNATTAYDLNLDAPDIEGLDYELLVYRLNETPVTDAIDGCVLTTEAQQQLILSQPDPTAGPIDGTFYLAPGEQVLVTFRVLPDVSDPDNITPLDPVANFDVQTLTGQVTSQPTNTDGSPQPPEDQFGGSSVVPITYAIDRIIGAGRVTGTITTDGTLGVLGASNIVGFDLTLFDGTLTSVITDATPNTVVQIIGGLLTATASDLIFDWNGTPGSVLFQQNLNSGNDFWCVQSGAGGIPNLCSFTYTDTETVSVSNTNIQSIDRSFAGSVVVASVPLPLLASLWQGDGDALDSLGSNDGTLIGGAGFDDGRIGQAFSFDNATTGTQYVRVADDPSLVMTTTMTMAAWIYPTSDGLGTQPIILNKEGEYEFARVAGGSIEWAFAGLGGANYDWVVGAPTGSAPLDTWTHVAVTFDNGTVVTYINGVQVSSAVRPTPVIGDYFPALNELWIGGRQATVFNAWFDGRIDEPRVYDSALSATQVLDLYNSAPPFIISSFDPSVVFSGTSPVQQAALNAAVGVTGYTIEDFEDLTLVPGLSITGGEFGFGIASAFPNAVWDGTSYYVDRMQVSAVNFSIAGGTSSFGIGMGDIDAPNVHLFVNGQDFGSLIALPNWVKLGNDVRDVYVRVDAAPGETITDVRIEQSSGGFNDGIFLDHVAFVASPTYSVDFDRLEAPPVSFGGSEYLDHGVELVASNCTSCYTYPCFECSPASASGASYLAVNSAGAASEAAFTAVFRSPVTSAPTTATDVSVYVNDTELSVALETFDITDAPLAGCANVFSGCPFATPSGNTVILNIPGPIAKLRLIDSGGDGHVIDDVTFTLGDPIPPTVIVGTGQEHVVTGTSESLQGTFGGVTVATDDAHVDLAGAVVDCSLGNTNRGIGVHLLNRQDVYINRGRVENCNVGVLLGDPDANAGGGSGNRVDGVEVRDSGSGSATSFDGDGIVVNDGSGNRLWDNQVTNVGGSFLSVGIRLWNGSDNEIRQNTVDSLKPGSSLPPAGILLQGADNCSVVGNSVTTSDRGIWLQSGALGNLMTGNTALSNSVFDLLDDNLNCADNFWAGNTFGTSNNATCID